MTSANALFSTLSILLLVKSITFKSLTVSTVATLTKPSILGLLSAMAVYGLSAIYKYDMKSGLDRPPEINVFLGGASDSSFP